ncbi:MAG TPA: hypothetical protein PLK90_09575 [Clostridiales bacterium]|nr:hypothetical protein [Clostridiales bacterium]HQP70635.1 hypothetical protein [Clostridiales bacterium]
MGIFLNKKNSEKKTQQDFTLPIGEYIVELAHPELIALQEDIDVDVFENSKKSIQFNVGTEQWFINKQSFWAKNKWSGLIATGALAGTGLLCNMMSNNYYDDYKGAEDTSDALDYKEKTKDFESYRDISYYASGSVCIYTLWSWYKEAFYKGRIENRRK